MATLLKQSTAVEIGMGPFLDETDGKTAETALTITQPDIRLKKNGGAWAQKNAAQTLSHEENGWYEVALDTTDTNTVGILIVAIHESGALPVWREFIVLPAAIYDWLTAGAAPLTPTTAGRTLDVSAGGEAGVDWANVGSPTTTLNLSGTTIKTATDVETDTQDIQGRLPAALTADGNIKADSLRISGSATAADNVEIVFSTDFATNYDSTNDRWTVNVKTWNDLTTVALPLIPTVAGRTLDVSAGGEAGIDWANVGTPGSTVNLSATTVNLVNTLTTYTGNTVQTGDSFARIGAAGAGLTDLGGMSTTMKAQVETEANDALVGQNLDHLVKIAVDTNFATTVHADSVIGQLADNGAGFDRTTDSLEAIRDRGDAAWTTATGFSTHSAADVWAVATRVLTAATNITSTGGTITVSSGSVSVYDFTAAAKALIQTEAEDAIVVHRLDELLNADSDIDGAAPPTVGSVFHELMTKTAGSFTFDQATDSLEALRDRGDAAWTTATGFSTHTAADVWAVGTRVLTAGTNIALAKGTGVTGFNDLSAADVRTAVGLASANLDTQLDALPTAAENFTAVLTTQMTESYAADGTAPTLAQAVFLVMQSLHEFAISGTTRTVKKIDGTTTAATFTLDSASAPTSTTRAS